MARTETKHETTGALTRAPEDHAAGYAVRDPLGRKVGRVERLYLNPDGDPEYVAMKTGPLGLKSVLLPVQMAEVDEERRVLHLR
jgi:hypothetical protein